jgi:hypothetical protein
LKAFSINATTFKLFKKGSKTKLGAAVSYSTREIFSLINEALTSQM